MPTKPGTTYTHATDLNFGSGPASGQPTKIVDPAATSQGFIPGQGVDAEAVNYLFNLSGAWMSDWVSLGTSAADLDAHIIETDANGTAAIATINAGNTAATTSAITAVENSGATAVTITATNSSGGVALGALASGGGVGVSADVFDTCDGVIGQVRGSGVAVTGRVFAGATGAALKGEGQVGGGPVLDLEFNATTPARGLAALQATDEPTAPATGDVWRRPDESAGTYDRRGGIEFQDDLGAPGKTGPGKLRAWATPEGVEFFASSVVGPNQNISNTVFVTAGSLTIPKEVPLGQYVIEWSSVFAPDPTAAAGESNKGYIRCKINGGTVGESQIEFTPVAGIPAGSMNTPRSAQFSGRFVYTQVLSPAPADIEIIVEHLSSTDPIAAVGVKSGITTITCTGVYDV